MAYDLRGTALEPLAMTQEPCGLDPLGPMNRHTDFAEHPPKLGSILVGLKGVEGPRSAPGKDPP